MQMIHTVSSLTLTLILTSGSSFTKIRVIMDITMTFFKQCGCWVGTRGGGGGSVAAHSIFHPKFWDPFEFLLQHHCGTALPRGGGGREDGGGVGVRRGKAGGTPSI